jgi:hypothetical protein
MLLIVRVLFSIIHVDDKDSPSAFEREAVHSVQTALFSSPDAVFSPQSRASIHTF